MKKIIFIIPYYGKFPSFFREWTYTAGFLGKQNIDFLLITDLEVGFTLPDNVKLEKFTFDELRERIQSFFEFRVSLDTPYKLCDFKPMLGLLFQDMIKEYHFWGHCDMDLIWGDVRRYISDDILNTYDKVQCLGHFVLYKNCERMNNLFRLDGAIYPYETVFSTPEYYSFDEHPGVMQIVIKHGVSNFISILEADISPVYSRLIVSRAKNYKYQILYWHNGRVFRKYIDEDGQIKSDEFMYAHFQHKHPSSLHDWERNKTPIAFKYSAKSFEYVDPTQIDKDFLLSCSDYISEKVDKRERKLYILKKMFTFLRCSCRKKIIWIKIRRATTRLNNYLQYKGC